MKKPKAKNPFEKFFIPGSLYKSKKLITCFSGSKPEHIIDTLDHKEFFICIGKTKRIKIRTTYFIMALILYKDKFVWMLIEKEKLNNPKLFFIKVDSAQFLIE